MRSSAAVFPSENESPDYHLTLLVRLRLMQATESDRQRRKLIAAVIEEICAKLARQRKQARLAGKENQWPLGNPRFADTKRHGAGR